MQFVPCNVQKGWSQINQGLLSRDLQLFIAFLLYRSTLLRKRGWRQNDLLSNHTAATQRWDTQFQVRTPRSAAEVPSEEVRRVRLTAVFLRKNWKMMENGNWIEWWHIVISWWNSEKISHVRGSFPGPSRFWDRMLSLHFVLAKWSCQSLPQECLDQMDNHSAGLDELTVVVVSLWFFVVDRWWVEVCQHMTTDQVWQGVGNPTLSFSGGLFFPTKSQQRWNKGYYCMSLTYINMFCRETEWVSCNML